MNNVVKITRAKKKSKNHLGFLGLLLIIAIICFFLLSPIFAIDYIEVKGNVASTAKYIISSSGILYGENILRINKFDAISKISNIPVIETASIKREWPDKIIITVKEKEPVAEVAFYGSKLLISENGDVINVITDNTNTALPILEGITVKDVIVGEKLICEEDEKLKNYLEVLKKLKENDMLKNVVSIVDNSGILVNFEIGHMVFFGDIDNLQHKIDWLRGILEKEKNPAYIDLHNLDKVITKPVWEVVNETKTSDIDADNTVANTQDEIRGESNEE